MRMALFHLCGLDTLTSRFDQQSCNLTCVLFGCGLLVAHSMEQLVCLGHVLGACLGVFCAAGCEVNLEVIDKRVDTALLNDCSNLVQNAACNFLFFTLWCTFEHFSVEEIFFCYKGRAGISGKPEEQHHDYAC
eukprot:TRINITY_DN22913_c0_g1_i1.p1 TRINITY_DN22913_c0_g1~~TRINITY_DN22913_c0_g1_i1.p1  ORF type:complete len:133 (+),score=24.68 TRINITY_DN22913_c0_g1_i1:198-596(+)